MTDSILQSAIDIVSDIPRWKLLAFGAGLSMAMYQTFSTHEKKEFYKAGKWNYQQLCKMIQGENIPCMIVDQDIFTQNVKNLCSYAKQHEKYVRIASKSLRCPRLMQQIFKIATNISGEFKSILS